MKLKDKIERVRAALEVIEDGLKGKPRTLGEAHGQSVERHLLGVGIELRSETAIKKRGYRLKRGAQPLVLRYFGAPIQRATPLYDLNSQCVRTTDAAEPQPIAEIDMFVLVVKGQPLSSMWAETLSHTELGCWDRFAHLYGRSKVEEYKQILKPRPLKVSELGNYRRK